MIHRRAFLGASTTALGACAIPLLARAQPAAPGTWPQRPIRLIVPFPPGGSADFLGRLVADRLNHGLGWTVVVDNRAGAAGNIGLEAVARSAPDGYTLGIGQTANLAINPSLYPKMAFDPLKDLVPVALVASQPMVVTVKADAPYQTLAELLAAAKGSKEPLRVAFAGNGTVAHLAIELIERQAGISLLNVPYKGAGPAVNDLRAGHVDFFVGNSVSVLGPVKGGSLRALAVTSPARLKALAQVPTVGEAGLAGIDAQTWSGVVAPVGVPQPILERVHAQVNRVIAQPEVLAKFAAEGSTPANGQSMQQFAALVRAEHRTWGDLVRQAKIQIE